MLWLSLPQAVPLKELWVRLWFRRWGSSCLECVRQWLERLCLKSNAFWHVFRGYAINMMFIDGGHELGKQIKDCNRIFHLCIKKAISTVFFCFCICICLRIYVYVHIYIYLCIHIYIYIYIHTYIHMCVYIYILIHTFRFIIFCYTDSLPPLDPPINWPQCFQERRPTSPGKQDVLNEPLLRDRSWFLYPLVNIRTKSCWKWPFSSLIYPLKMVIFHSYANVYQRVVILY